MKQRFPIAFVVFAVISFSLTVPAQETNLSTTKPTATNRPPQITVAGRILDGPMFNVLTEEQHVSATKLLEGQQEKIRDLQSKLRTMRQDMISSGLSGRFDEDSIRKQASTVANLEAELTVLRLKLLSEIQPPLSPEQVNRIRNAGIGGPPPNVRPVESRPGRQRILQSVPRDENDLPPKQ